MNLACRQVAMLLPPPYWKRALSLTAPDEPAARPVHDPSLVEGNGMIMRRLSTLFVQLGRFS